MKRANVLAQRRARLADEDWRVKAALDLDAVSSHIEVMRGVLVDRFFIGDEDVTHSVLRLQHAGLARPTRNDDYDRMLQRVIARKLARIKEREK